MEEKGMSLVCKCCGAPLRILPGRTVLTCEYCGVTQTVPASDEERRVMRFNRANELRIGCDFDAAASIFQNLAAEYPEEAEYYWGLVLCCYGVEYVWDPQTERHIPTCHKTESGMVRANRDYIQALAHATPEARAVYLSEGERIENIRVEIMRVSLREDASYDIFLCFKDKDENGLQTEESRQAYGMYRLLTEGGYRVFYAPVSMRDKLGQPYEPYIFCALNSAQVMLAFGTSRDAFEAPWVKNEWSRYLRLAEKGRTLIVCCCSGMEPEELPDELRSLQAQDMTHPEARRTLLRIIRSRVRREAEENIVPEDDPHERAAALYEAADRAFEGESFKEAERLYAEGLQLEPEDFRAQYRVGLSRLRSAASGANCQFCEQAMQRAAKLTGRTPEWEKQHDEDLMAVLKQYMRVGTEIETELQSERGCEMQEYLWRDAANVMRALLPCLYDEEQREKWMLYGIDLLARWLDAEVVYRDGWMPMETKNEELFVFAARDSAASLDEIQAYLQKKQLRYYHRRSMTVRAMPEELRTRLENIHILLAEAYNALPGRLHRQQELEQKLADAQEMEQRCREELEKRRSVLVEKERRGWGDNPLNSMRAPAMAAFWVMSLYTGLAAAICVDVAYNIHPATVVYVVLWCASELYLWRLVRRDIRERFVPDALKLLYVERRRAEHAWKQAVWEKAGAEQALEEFNESKR